MKSFVPSVCRIIFRFSTPLICLFPSLPCYGQILDEWSYLSVADDASIHGESSAVVAVGDSYMFVGDNEHELLRLYARVPPGPCLPPVYSFDARPFLNLSSSNPEADIEAAAAANVDGSNWIYWLGSHGNSVGGNTRTNRNRFFATLVVGDGTGSPPYSLAYIGRYEHLRTDLINWDKNNLHGKGANYYRLEASTASGVGAEAVDGFNIEGFCMAPDGTTGYLAFRTPLVNASGATTSNGQRTNALIIPLLNPHDLVTNSLVPGPGKARFGTPIILNLGKRGIRSLDSRYPGNYLITAGPTGSTSNPPEPPADFRLFTWTGNPADSPVEHFTTFPADYSPEGAIPPAAPIETNSLIQFVSDDSFACWRSFTTRAGIANIPALEILPPLSNKTASMSLLLVPTQTVLIEYSTNLTQWQTLKSVNGTNAVTPFTDTAATNQQRFYRARF